MKTLVQNAADVEQVKKAGNRILNGRQAELDDLRFILSSAAGRRFYWRYLTKCGLFQTSFTGNSATFYNEGQRNIGLALLADLNEADPESYVKMMKESKEGQS